MNRTAGERTELIQIEQPTGETGSRGQPSGDWQSIDQLTAHVETLAGRQLEQARQVYAVATHRVTTWQPTGYRISTGHRARWLTARHGERILEIGHVDDHHAVDAVLLCGETAN